MSLQHSSRCKTSPIDLIGSRFSLVAALLMHNTTAQADLTALAGTFSSELEEQSAIATQRLFDELDPFCGGSTRSTECDDQTFGVYSNVRELVHTANDLTSGPTDFSLRLNPEGLGFALRWTAAEEMAAQESMTTEFVASQLAAIANRLTVLRRTVTGIKRTNYVGAHDINLPHSLPAVPEVQLPAHISDDHIGLQQHIDSAMPDIYRNHNPWRIVSLTTPIVSYDANNSHLYDSGNPYNNSNLRNSSNPQHADNGGISAGESYTPWSFYLNTNASYGSKEPTELEDAFDFDTNELSLGFDYVMSPKMFVGALVGYSTQEVDFDSSASIVDGDIETDGYSFMLYSMWNESDWYASGTLGYQLIDFDITRSIKYPSLNPDVASVNETATSSSDSTVLTLSVGVGYSFKWQKVSLEPYITTSLKDVTIDGFTEQGARGFNFTFEEQSFDVTEIIAGLKLQTIWLPSWAVVIPYGNLRWHNQSTDDRNVTAVFSNISSSLGAVTRYSIPVDDINGSFNSIEIGVSAVVRGGRQYEVGGLVAGGLQLVAAYQSVFGYEDYEEDSFTLGLRYEF